MPFIVMKKDFRKTWVCEVLRSGLHSGATCRPDDPHAGCHWSWVFHKEYSERTWEVLTAPGGAMDDPDAGTRWEPYSPPQLGPVFDPRPADLFAPLHEEDEK